MDALIRSLRIFLFVCIGLLILIPVFWQPHIQAGDLSSHIYNAWLAGEIEQGHLPGLAIKNAPTNVLSDVILELLMRKSGRALAERVVVSAAVEIFFWGAFYFVFKVAQRCAPYVMPFLAMLAYGLVFQFGFLNFYLATGFSLWIAALLWRPSIIRIVLCAPLTALAFTAHALPLAIVAAASVYVAILRRVRPNRRQYVLIGGVLAIIGAHFVLSTMGAARWSFRLDPDTLFGAVGTQQFLIYGSKYWIAATGITAIWALLLADWIDQGELWGNPISHLWVLSIAGFLLMPDAIEFRQYDNPLAYIPQRLSLLTALLFCAMVAKLNPKRAVICAAVLVAGIYFAALYADVRALNQLEEQIAKLVRGLPRGRRVVAALADSGSVLNGAVHLVSAACIGNCYDYANYEPATKQFRIRALGPNPAVAFDMNDVHDLEFGKHKLRADEGEVYEICLAGSTQPRLAIRLLRPGETNCLSVLPVTPQLFRAPQ